MYYRLVDTWKISVRVEPFQIYEIMCYGRERRNVPLGKKPFYLFYLDVSPTNTWRCKSTGASRGGMIDTVIFSRTWFAAGWLNSSKIQFFIQGDQSLTLQGIRLWIILLRKASPHEWLYLNGRIALNEMNQSWNILTIGCFHFNRNMCLEEDLLRC